MDSVQETWRPVVGFEGKFEVSNIGRVKSLSRLSKARNHAVNGKYRVIKGQMLSPIATPDYPRVALVPNKRHCIHVLVAEAFIGPRLPGFEVNHKDGDKNNSRLENLEYVTPKENIAHAYRTGLMSHAGVKNANCSFSEEQIRKAYEIFASGKSLREAAAESGVSKNVVRCVVSGTRWTHLGLAPLRSRLPCEKRRTLK